MKSGSSYDFVVERFLGMDLFSIGIILFLSAPFGAAIAPQPRYAVRTVDALWTQEFGTRPDRSKERWQTLPSERDILLLRNQPNHIIEGFGAAGMLLGETETELRQRYGAPAYRNGAAPETLYYNEEMFNAEFVLRNGRIGEIHLEVPKHKSPSLEWFTALGLHETQLRSMSAPDAAIFLTKFYQTRRLRQIGDTVDVMSRGIRFRFRGKSVIFVDVMPPTPYAADE